MLALVADIFVERLGTGDKIDIARQTSALGIFDTYKLSGIDQITGNHVFQRYHFPSAPTQ